MDHRRVAVGRWIAPYRTSRSLFPGRDLPFVVVVFRTRGYLIDSNVPPRILSGEDAAAVRRAVLWT